MTASTKTGRHTKACRSKKASLTACATAALFMTMSSSAVADRIENNIAVFAGLDKVTARISSFEVKLGETVKFGTLKVTPRVCYSRPATERPKTTTFVEVDEVQLDGTEQRLFAGWMFAESPGLHGVEHPTVDVWLTNCKKPLRTTTERRPNASGEKADDAYRPEESQDGGRDDFEFRRRFRR